MSIAGEVEICLHNLCKELNSSEISGLEVSGGPGKQHNIARPDKIAAARGPMATAACRQKSS
jgi:hypothetical protein